MKLEKIAELVKGQLRGEGGIEISGVAPLKKARAGEITFLFNKKYRDHLSQSSPSAVIVQEEMNLDIPCVIVENPQEALSCLLEIFHPQTGPKPGIAETAFIGKDVRIGDGVSVFPFVTIDDRAVIGKGVSLYPGVFIGQGVEIGDFSTVYPHVTIHAGSVIGSQVMIHSGSVIGGEGFGFFQGKDGEYKKIPQVGGVVIEDRVEICANTCIDRGTLDDTVIKKGTKIDNLVQIAHNVTIGENTVIAGQSGISGSSVIGSGVRMGGKVGIADHVTIADNTALAANTGVAGDLKTGVYSGSPAVEHGKWKRIQVSLLRLPDMVKQMRALEKRIGELEKREDS